MFRHQLTYALVFLAINGCRSPRPTGSLEQYVDQGKLWAYGSVELTDLSGPGQLLLQRKAAGQTLYTYTLVGSQGGDVKDLAYVDYHPREEKLLAFVYRLEFRSRNGQDGDVFAVLDKGGRSLGRRLSIPLGTARFAPGVDQAEFQPRRELKTSLIADGPFSGLWAVHYPDVRRVVLKPWQGLCPRFVSQAPTQGPGQGPGQNPGQTPGQFDFCRLLPPKDDLCQGNPTKDGCRPPAPVQMVPAPGQTLRWEHDGSLLPLTERRDVLAMPGEQRESRLTFSSATMAAATEEENNRICSGNFYVTARTVGGLRNGACHLAPAPAAPKDGKATCGVLVRFERAETYLEKVCELSVVFRSETDEVQRVQVLKR